MERIIYDKNDFENLLFFTDYCIYESPLRKGITNSILLKINLDKIVFSINNVDDYISRLKKYAEEIIEGSNPHKLLDYCEYVRETMSIGEFPKEHLQYFLSMDDAACWIQSLAINRIGKNKGTIKRNDLLYLYEIFRMSDELVKKNQFRHVHPDYSFDFEEAFEPIEDDRLDKFIYRNEAHYQEAGVEEAVIIDSKLRDKLIRKKLLPELIYKKNDMNLFSVLEFTYSDIDNFMSGLEEFVKNKAGARCFFNQNHVRINQERFISRCKKKIESEHLRKIIDFLLVTSRCNRIYEDLSRENELRCIYLYDGELCFGYHTLIKSLYLIKVLSICGQFPSLFNMNDEQQKLFVNAQHDFSTFFSYHIGDLLDQNGYILPRKIDGTIEVEIKQIELKSKKKLYFKDIDVLALDVEKKHLLNLELKYYKGKVTYNSALTDSLDNKDFKNFMIRQKIIEDNMKEIIEEKFGIMDSEGYKVVPIYITARTNSNTKDVKEYDYLEFINAVNNCNLA